LKQKRVLAGFRAAALGEWGAEQRRKRSCLKSSVNMVIELVEMTISTKYSGFDKLNHRFSYLLDSLLIIIFFLQRYAQICIIIDIFS
jgi:hypothetical protein